MKLAITGATGFVGSALLERALDEGFDVAALTRRPQPERKRVRWVSGDLGDRPALDDLARDADVVLHVAGVVNAPDARGFEEGNVAGTRNLVEAMRAAGARRLVFVSSLSAREPRLSDYGASKARAEQLVSASGLDWTVVRPPAIYGPRDREMLELFKAAKWGVVPVPAEGSASVIHVEDLARLLVALVPTGEGVRGAIFEPDDARPGGWAHDDLARAIGEAVGRRVRVLGLSRGAMEMAARLDTFFRGTGAKMTRDRAAYFSHPDWVVSAGARPPAQLWQPDIATPEGLAATARWYRAQGWL